MNGSDQMNLPLFREDYQPEVDYYPIQVPEIKSGAAYYFETESGLSYQVLFAKKKNSYLENIVNFSVLNDEFEDEYSETNRGEIYRVISTVVEIIRIYHSNHAYSTSYEFSGEFKKGNEHRKTSIRTLLYFRKAKEIMYPGWEIEIKGNRVVVHRKKRK
ncbi:MAG: hypothetical protein KAT15_10130 [Bacteroidales bacterium]|nr:hypothetical protein [Bacteroidales bacterium]